MFWLDLDISPPKTTILLNPRHPMVTGNTQTQVLPHNSDSIEALYHYTNWDGLCGILKDQSLWATHHRFTNDASETLLFKKDVIEYLQMYSKHEEIKALSISDIEKYVDGELQKPFADCFYIASFCGHVDEYPKNHGLLSQWRAYGNDGGFAVVFDKEKLEEMLIREQEIFNYLAPTKLHDVEYADSKKSYVKEFEENMKRVDDFVYAYKSCLENRTPEKEMELTKQVATAFPAYWEGMCRLKHWGFHEEKEFRIVSILPSADIQIEFPDRHYKEIKFREKKGAQIPYIELFVSLTNPLPIKKIIVGPQRNKEERASILKAKLQNDKRVEVKGIEVFVSEIPYIEPM